MAQGRGARVASIGDRMQGYGTAVAAVTSTLVLLVAAGEADAGRMTAGRLVVFYTVLGLLLPILRQVVIANRYLQEAQISVERLSETQPEFGQTYFCATLALCSSGHALHPGSCIAHPVHRCSSQSW